MRCIIVGGLILAACSDEAPRRTHYEKPAAPAHADLGPAAAYEPMLRRRCAGRVDPCFGCVDRVSGGKVRFMCDQQEPRHVTQIEVFAGSPDMSMRDGIHMAIAYLEPVMTDSREAKLRHMALHAGQEMVPPLDLGNIVLDSYSVDGLVVDVSGWLHFPNPGIGIQALSQDTVSTVQTEWTVDKVPKRNWKRKD